MPAKVTYVVATTHGVEHVQGVQAELRGGWLTIYSGGEVGDTPNIAAQYRSSVVIAWRAA